MKFAGSALLIIGLLLTGFVGVPLRWRLEARLGHENLYRKAKAARKAGDPEAKMLFVVGWCIVSIYAIGIALLRFN